MHYGHLRAALEARELLELDDFRLLPAGSPPHRGKPMALARDRLAMLKLAVDAYPEFAVDDREIRRDGYSYMADTLAEIRTEVGAVPVLLFVGQDAANALDSWHEWRSLFALAHIVIMRRPEARPSWAGELKSEMSARLVKDARQLRVTEAGSVLPLPVTQLAISSTDIRKRMREGRSARFLMPDCVIDYIERKQLYFAGQVRKG